MATEVSVLVEAVKDECRDGISTNLSNNQIAGIVGAAVDWCNLHAASYCDYTISSLSANRVVPSSSIAPSVTGKNRTLVLTVALWKMARSGAIKRAELNTGSVTLVSHSANPTSTVVQHRLNASEFRDEVVAALAALKGMDQHAAAEVDFTALGG